MVLMLFGIYPAYFPLKSSVSPCSICMNNERGRRDLRSSGGEDVVGCSIALGETAFYAVTELCGGLSIQYTNKVDVYAYGMLMYAMFLPDMGVQSEDDWLLNPNRPLLPRIASGAHYKRAHDINDAYWELITMSWQGSPAQRPTFTEIVDAIVANLPNFILPNADIAQVR
jgi:hypothetical protein